MFTLLPTLIRLAVKYFMWKIFFTYCSLLFTQLVDTVMGYVTGRNCCAHVSQSQVYVAYSNAVITQTQHAFPFIKFN